MFPDPATGQETSRCLERENVRCAELIFRKKSPRNAALMGGFFIFRLLVHVTEPNERTCIMKKSRRKSQQILCESVLVHSHPRNGFCRSQDSQPSHHPQGNSCSLCGGELASLGQLGMLKWFVCIRCGMQFSRKAGGPWKMK